MRHQFSSGLEGSDGDRRRTPSARCLGPARSVILIFLHGGAATQDMFDLKPDAPVEIRGEFAPIATNVPGIRICEHLPRMSRWMHRVGERRCHSVATNLSEIDRDVTRTGGFPGLLMRPSGLEPPPGKPRTRPSTL